jgi:hypothetical protein
MKTTATDLRTHLYSWLDRIAGTGEVLEVERKGIRIRIIRDEPVSRLALLPKRSTMLVAPDLIVETGWAEAWQPDAP